MQSVAQAYKQTQAGTMGQGEVVVMLFDGALRFLAQAKEKMQTRNYAAKGILISKALDVISELDSSLNMEAGGEIAQNLHQLYFMCNTRLLQANLKLDVTLLDSVVEILNGLRSAFFEIIHTPEALAAAATISAKQAGKQQATTARPLQKDAPGTAAPQFANNRYAMQQSLPVEGVAPVVMPPLQPRESTAPGADPVAPLSQAELARARAAMAKVQGIQGVQPPPVSPVPAETLAKAQAALGEVQAAQAATQSGAIPVVPQAEMPLSENTLPLNGFAGKRISAYGRVMRVK